MKHELIESISLGTTARRRDLAAGMAFAFIAHAALFAWTAGLEKRPLALKKKRTRTVSMDVVLPKRVEKPKPKPPEKKVAKKVEEAPKPPKPKPPRKVAKKRKRAAKKRAPRPVRKKVAKKTPPPTKPPEPAPLVLSKTYQGAGGVVVEKGDDDILGDGRIEVTERNRTPQPPTADPDDGEEELDDDEEEDVAEIVVKHARPKRLCRVSWPEEAPVQRRIVAIRLLLTVNKTGKVAKAKVLRSMGDPFDSAAVAALRSCAFEPGTRNGVPFTDRVPFLVEFRPDTGV